MWGIAEEYRRRVRARKHPKYTKKREVVQADDTPEPHGVRLASQERYR